MTTPKRIPVRHVLAWIEDLALTGVDEVLSYTWVPETTTAVLGLSQKAERELNLENVSKDMVVRRASGGGAVILTEGVLCFGVIAPPSAIGEKNDIHASFKNLTAHVTAAASELGLKAKISGISDIAIEVGDEFKKITGCAQMRKKNAVLVHGSLLVEADTQIFEKYLAWPSETPDYRGKRSHSDFCTTLKSNAPDCSVSSVNEMLCRFAKKFGWKQVTPPETLTDNAQYLFNEKYSKDAWNFERKRPPLK